MSKFLVSELPMFEEMCLVIGRLQGRDSISL